MTWRNNQVIIYISFLFLLIITKVKYHVTVVTEWSCHSHTESQVMSQNMTKESADK